MQLGGEPVHPPSPTTPALALSPGLLGRVPADPAEAFLGGQEGAADKVAAAERLAGGRSVRGGGAVAEISGRSVRGVAKKSAGETKDGGGDEFYSGQAVIRTKRAAAANPTDN